MPSCSSSVGCIPAPTSAHGAWNVPPLPLRPIAETTGGSAFRHPSYHSPMTSKDVQEALCLKNPKSEASTAHTLAPRSAAALWFSMSWAMAVRSATQSLLPNFPNLKPRSPIEAVQEPDMKRPDLNPGSNEARVAGCKCPVMDNSHGKGWMGGVKGEDGQTVFVISELCPLHQSELE